MSRYLNIVGAAQLAALDATDLAAWETSNPLEDDAVIDFVNPAIVYWDGSAAQRIEFGGGAQSYAAQHPNQTGALIDTNLIGLAQVTGVFINGSMSQWVVDGSPIAGVIVNIDTTTGEVDPGYSWDGDFVVVQYSSTIPPIAP
jgi:hypothetical protein